MGAAASIERRTERWKRRIDSKRASIKKFAEAQIANQKYGPPYFDDYSGDLMFECRQPSVSIVGVHECLASGADPNMFDVSDWRNTPLHYCCRNGHIVAARMLFKAGARADMQNAMGQTALFEAALGGQWSHCQLASLLIANGANLELYDKGGKSPLTWAVMEDHTKMTQLLIKAGALTKRATTKFLTLKGTSALDAARDMQRDALEAVNSEREAREGAEEGADLRGDSVELGARKLLRVAEKIGGGSGKEARLKHGSQIVAMVENANTLENLSELERTRLESPHSVKSQIARRGTSRMLAAARKASSAAASALSSSHRDREERRGAADLSVLKPDRRKAHHKEMEQLREVRHERRREAARRHQRRREEEDKARLDAVWQARRQRAKESVDKDRQDREGSSALYNDARPRGKWRVHKEWRMDRDGWRGQKGAWVFVEEPSIKAKNKLGEAINNRSFYEQNRRERKMRAERKSSVDEEGEVIYEDSSAASAETMFQLLQEAHRTLPGNSIR